MPSPSPRTLAFAAALALAACGDRAAAPVTPAPAPVRLVVLLVIDQLPSWTFDRDRAQLRGGLARLVAGGAYYAQGEYPYASTWTATGHAALSTGAPARVTGVIGNKWFDRAADRSRDATDDPDAPLLAAWPGAAVGPGQSSRALLVPGLGDALRAATGGRGRSVSIAMKDRSAILLGGQRPDLAIWYDEVQPAMTTSRFYADALPAWLAAEARARPIAARLTETWRPLDDALLARLTGNPDDAPGEGDSEGGLDATFPHRPADAAEPPVALQPTPMATDALFDTAEAAIAGERLGADEVADLLAISVSSHDYAGHAWGQESWERLDLLLRLDARVGELLDHLDRTVGAGRYAVVLTSDHGGVPLVEQGGVPGARRVPKRELLEVAERALDGVLGDGAWTRDVQATSIYLAPAFHARPAADQARALDAAARAVAAVPGIAGAAPSAARTGDCAARTGAERLACEAIHPGRTGELWFDLADGCLTSDYPSGTGHGGPSLAERRVPIVVFAPGIAPREVRAPVSILRVAPTVARLLGVAPPAAATEPPLD